MNDTGFKELKIGKYRITLHEDYDSSPFEQDLVEVCRSNPLSELWHHEGEIKIIGNYAYTALREYHSQEWIYVRGKKSVPSLQKAFTKLGYSKNNAWLKALSLEKKTFEYISDWLDQNWFFIGIVIEKECESCGQWDHIDSLWGVEYSVYSDNNEPYLRDILSDMLPTELQSRLEDIILTLLT